jgi:hypothetical protein
MNFLMDGWMHQAEVVVVVAVEDRDRARNRNKQSDHPVFVGSVLPPLSLCVRSIQCMQPQGPAGGAGAA